MVSTVPPLPCTTTILSSRVLRGEAASERASLLAFPPSQWKGVRTTNALERINGEFRRRTKTQASLPNEDAVVLLLFGLLRSGQVVLRRLTGWKEMPSASSLVQKQAA